MKRFSIVFVSLVLLSVFVYPIGMDTGMIEWKQPNGVTFMGRAWGNEFRGWMETEDGYRFVKNYEDGYYHYAILDANGEFAQSENKVGIDPPLTESYKLERSASRENNRQEFSVSRFWRKIPFSLHSSTVQRMMFEALLRCE